jgi:anti-sigma regulatory factor (Ser/Thr protein kinase)
MITITRNWEVRSYDDIGVVHASLEADVRAHVERIGSPGDVEKLIFEIRLALEEGLVNHCKHGNQMDPAKKVDVSAVIVDRTLVVNSKDEGEGFDPDDVPDPRDIENLERPCGRGLTLIETYTGIRGGSHEYLERGTRLKMTFVLGPRLAKESA